MGEQTQATAVVDTTRLLRQQPSLLEPKKLHLFSQDATPCEASTARTVNFLASTAAHWGGWRERRNAEADKCACAVKIRVACCAACRFASEAPHVHTTPPLRLDTSEEWDDTDCQMVSRRVIHLPLPRDGEIDRGRVSTPYSPPRSHRNSILQLALAVKRERHDAIGSNLPIVKPIKTAWDSEKDTKFEAPSVGARL